MSCYSSEAEALRDILRDAYSLKHIDAGDGWSVELDLARIWRARLFKMPMSCSSRLKSGSQVTA
jgi:hypothetical protein